MLRITYENKLGKLQLGGGRDTHIWRILEADGLGLTAKQFNTVTYPTEIGQHTMSETINARTITLKCDIRSPKGAQFEIARALRILNRPGTLTIHSGITKRKINARCAAAEQGERHGGYRVFVMQFLCDYPYFEDTCHTNVPIFRRENLIGSGRRWYFDETAAFHSQPISTNQFILPCMFSRRTSSANVMNLGDVDTEPVLQIYIQGNLFPEAGRKIRITNNATNQTIEMNLDAYIADEAEKERDITKDEITLNIPERTVYNIYGENLISILSNDSFLSAFWLECGNNIIEVENSVSARCAVMCEFSNKYIEAVLS